MISKEKIKYSKKPCRQCLECFGKQMYFFTINYKGKEKAHIYVFSLQFCFSGSMRISRLNEDITLKKYFPMMTALGEM
jgi:hypothetical protein